MKENDSETGMEAFELRLWDGRLGRWLTVDPYHQYYSPYVGMGNEPINGIDPDGGCYIKNSDGSYSPCPDGKVGEKRKDAFGYNWHYTKSKGWQLEGGAKNIQASYNPILADGNAEYYIKRYVDHIQRYNSKPPDYYLGYGHKYINRFKKETRPKLSNAGKKWLDRTAVSLQSYIEKGLRATNGNIAMNNEDFHTYAFDTHVPAYVNNGLIGLSLGDKATIGLTPDLGDLFSTDGVKQAAIILTIQQLQWTFNAMNWMSNKISDYQKSNCNCGR